MKSGGYFHHNNIHHCQMNGLGYGIIVANGSASLIEANYFDYCRHAIVGDGHVNNGYEVRYNLFGYNFPKSNNAHVVDMHGVSTASGNVAGDRLIIHHNTFEAISTTDYCIAVRGDPPQNRGLHRPQLDQVYRRSNRANRRYNQPTQHAHVHR